MSTVDINISFLTGKSWFSSELQSIGMALQANIIVQSRYQNNHRQESYYFWFYRFLQSVLIGYSGGIFGTIFLGKPCPFLVNGDIHMTACLVAFGLVQIILPFVRSIFSPNSDISSSSSNIIKNSFTIPLQIVITSFAQLFRTMGLLKFITVCHLELLSPPYRTISTKYYEIPIFGPILYGTMLGNMGGFVLNGIDGYTQRSGIPYPFQNGKVLSIYAFCVAWPNLLCRSRMICVLLPLKELQKYHVPTNHLPEFQLDPFLYLTFSIDC